MKRTATIDQRISAINEDMHDAQRAHAAIALTLVEDPGNEKAQAQLEALEVEIAEHQRQVKRLEGAKEQAALRDSAEHKKAELVLLKQEHASLGQGLTRLHELAAALVGLFESVGPLLADYQKVADDNNSRAWRITKGACGTNEQLADRSFDEHFKRKTRGAGAVPSVINAVWASGLGRTGLLLQGFVDVGQCQTNTTLDEEMNEQQKDVLSKLATLIARREAELGGTLVEEAPPTQETRFIKGGRRANQDVDGFVAVRDRGFNP
jgi:hypothetical protein